MQGAIIFSHFRYKYKLSMASHKSKEELEEALSKLNEQYNGLL